MKIYLEWEAAKKLSLSISTIQRMCETGRLKGCHKIDDTWQIPQDNFITNEAHDIKAKRFVRYLDRKNSLNDNIDEFNL
ncbi:helix-turn-helix domain-containing protein [Terribacillus sp. 179-K 1B1 HS]|uniref:helix-turn-helix domain-containing protein n=1 Tax=Terribacillus sp. 179-K 1B1 HS TaxID=3142388 RepID=UPI0039A199ED